MVSITANDIVKLFEEDARARKRLAELLVSEPDVRLAIVNAVLRDVATRQDVERLREELRSEFRSEIGRLEERIEKLEERVARLEERVARLEERVTGLEERMDMFVKVFIAFNTPILVAVIGILIKLLLQTP